MCSHYRSIGSSLSLSASFAAVTLLHQVTNIFVIEQAPAMKSKHSLTFHCHYALHGEFLQLSN